MSPNLRASLSTHLRWKVLVNTLIAYKEKKFPLTTRFGVRNLLGWDIRYPSSSLDFRDQFPSRGAQIWLDITLEI